MKYVIYYSVNLFNSLLKIIIRRLQSPISGVCAAEGTSNSYDHEIVLLSQCHENKL